MKRLGAGCRHNTPKFHYTLTTYDVGMSQKDDPRTSRYQHSHYWNSREGRVDAPPHDLQLILWNLGVTDGEVDT